MNDPVDAVDAVKRSLQHDGWWALYAARDTDICHGERAVTIRFTDDPEKIEVWFPPDNPLHCSAESSIEHLRQWADVPSQAILEDGHGYWGVTITLQLQRAKGFSLYGDPLL